MTENPPERDSQERMRRHLRAATAVNRQLQAQLEGSSIRAIAPPTGAVRDDPGLLLDSAPVGPLTVRRASLGTGWLEELVNSPVVAKPFLVRRPDGATYVVEGRNRRRVKSGLLAAALEQRLGSRREVTEDELEQWPEAAPVELLECPTGPPFLVVGGQRIPIRGIPLTHPVSGDLAARLPEGPELNVSAGGLARVRMSGALSPRRYLDRARRASAKRGGYVPAAKAFVTRRLRGSSGKS
jgi:hypothetical protein